MQIRDPIHNFVVLPDELLPIVNSMVLQRLRGIRQLALASLVYPGALHTRFDHTLGVTHVVGLMGKQLKLDEGEIRLVQLAALLHDIGHGPFSHVSESSLSRFGDRNTLKDEQKQHKIHEVVTASIIRTDAELANAMPESDREKVIRLLGDEPEGRPVLKKLVSGPLDSDKQDYLLRDSHFCGVSYGAFDLHQLQRSLLIKDDELMIDPDGVHAVEQFVLAKYYMTSNVYRHRVRLITDQMIGRAIQLGIERDRIPEMESLFRFDNSPGFISNYQEWDDARFWETFCPLGRKAPGEKSGTILQKLRTRRLFKRVYSQRIGELQARIRILVQDLPKPKFDELRSEIEVGIADYLSQKLPNQPGYPIDPDLVILHSYDIKSARESSRNEQQEVLVADGERPKNFEEASTLFQSINEAYSDKFVEVYAPIFWPEPDRKDELREQWMPEIRNLIERACLAHRSGTNP